MNSELGRAVFFDGPGQPLRLETRPLPALQPGETLLRTRCATLCGSDLHTLTGRRPCPVPCVLGHEIVGEVVAGDRWPPATRLVVPICVSCHQCSYCRQGLTQKCARLFKYGHATGSPWFGGLAEYIHLMPDARPAVVPPALTDLEAAPAGCATATVVAVFRRCQPMDGQRVLILGAGMLGLTASAMAIDQGAAAVEVVDHSAWRRSLAQRFGAGATIDQADTVLDFTGSAAAMSLGLQKLRTGGRMVLAGSVYPGAPLALDTEQVVRKMWTLTGVHNYADEDLETGLRFLASVRERFPFGAIAGPVFELEEAAAAFQAAASEQVLRAAIRYCG